MAGDTPCYPALPPLMRRNPTVDERPFPYIIHSGAWPIVMCGGPFLILISDLVSSSLYNYAVQTSVGL